MYGLGWAFDFSILLSSYPHCIDHIPATQTMQTKLISLHCILYRFVIHRLYTLNCMWIGSLSNTLWLTGAT